MRFEFATANRILFGAGVLAELPAAARALGRRALVVTGRNPARAQPVLDLLASTGLATTTFAVAGEPTTDDAAYGAEQARAAGCDFVIGFGGGSALDAAKAIAALITNHGDLLDYLEVIGRAQPLAHPAAPVIAIPTTAGTGAEVTRNAVLASPAHRVKVSLRSPHMLPRVALVDPTLTHALSPELTATTGLDALTQLIEPYLSCRANPMTDALCVEGLRRAATSLWAAVDEGSNTLARENMAIASLFGGLALANAGLGAVHGFAGPIGGMFPAPHGAVCAALLPHVMRANLTALRLRAPESESLRRFDDLARLLTGRPHATAEEALRWIHDLVATLHIPRLSAYGLSAGDAPAVVAAAAKASSMKANPLPLTDDELHAIYTRAL
ncbi:iron-containing alcohol dehydrogenase [Opitutus terrae]|uniref:Iron-containing alcohol dehydrogenase n=1 Tax=Opitutus terrae (strain DSM 11246 / JCM 15787 / PB90-1) TaxID=452637 RepID=B1ZPD9_OPITP|nr:iron-containing alcohol dehydrogenase [Opitutus terrae]ACB73544.1 iron-containing alcohol dehydrogenase [Opitutus terrae PB90-1]